MRLKVFLPLLICLTTTGCKNDLFINAPAKEIPVIYSFLNQNDSIQYIRIEKLYQNSERSSTAQGAQITDSLYFDTLIVKLVNIVNGDTLVCQRIDSIPKKDGFFSTARNTLYAVKIPADNSTDEIYQLIVINPKNNRVFSAKTRIVKDAAIEYRKVVIRPATPNHAFTFHFVSGKNASVYDVIVRFQYKEMDIDETDPQNYALKTVDYFATRNKKYIESSDCFENIKSATYMDYLYSKILPDETKKRDVIGFLFQTYGGTPDFEDYLQLTTPAIGIVKKNTEYSNISGGLGIFSSRNFNEAGMGIDATTLAMLKSKLPNFIHIGRVG